MGSSSKNKKPQGQAGPPGGAPGRVGGSMPVQMGWKLDANGNPLPQDQQPMQDMPFAQPEQDQDAKMRAMLAQMMQNDAMAKRSQMMDVGGRGARGMGGAFGNGFGGGRGGNTPGGGYGGGKRGGGLY